MPATPSPGARRRYYIDHRNARAKYLDAWWDLVSWDFAQEQFKSA